jgi:hypothetical protein
MLDKASMKRPHLHLPHFDATTVELFVGALLIALVMRWLMI